MNCMENCGKAKKNTIVIFLQKNVCETLHQKKILFISQYLIVIFTANY